MTLKEQLDPFEQFLIIECYLDNRGHVTNTAKELDISKVKLLNRLGLYGLRVKGVSTDLFHHLMTERQYEEIRTGKQRDNTLGHRSTEGGDSH